MYNHEDELVVFAGDTHFTSINFPTLSPNTECASTDVSATLDSFTSSAISITVNDVDKRLEIVYGTINTGLTEERNVYFTDGNSVPIAHYQIVYVRLAVGDYYLVFTPIDYEKKMI